jgi:hypothetical protein
MRRKTSVLCAAIVAVWLVALGLHASFANDLAYAAAALAVVVTLWDVVTRRRMRL